jgi:hypothetical protein
MSNLRLSIAVGNHRKAARMAKLLVSIQPSEFQSVAMNNAWRILVYGYARAFYPLDDFGRKQFLELCHLRSEPRRVK